MLDFTLNTERRVKSEFLFVSDYDIVLHFILFGFVSYTFYHTVGNLSSIKNVWNLFS